MIHRLLDRLERPFTFVVGKGGVGKTTTAGGIALALADRGTATRIVSTDPAHSLTDLFDVPSGARSACTERLSLEEIDAEHRARERLDGLDAALREIIDRGTYLDEEDADTLLGGSLPGLDEIGAALRLQELSREGGRVVVDTAPTGHTLRMLDAPAVLEGWVRVFAAMAAKADTVASALVGQAVRLTGERRLEELTAELDAFARLARESDFVIVTGPGAVVRAESERLKSALLERGCTVAATVAVRRPGAEADLILPFDLALAGCDALRRWIAPGSRAGRRPAATSAPSRGRTSRPGPAPEVVPLLERELVVFAGKGGVGKTTCSAAAAMVLAAGGPVLLAGSDPAGSLGDVLPDPPASLEVRELDPERELERFRDVYRDEVERAFGAVGLDAARLDREVVESLWGLAPPGLDEVVAVARLAAEQEAGSRRIVLDTAPTGHFLRLVAMPALAQDWLRRIMRILLKYRALGGLDSPAEALVRFARRVRALQERLSDPSRTAIVIVTLDEPLVRAETLRLVERLRERGLPPAAVLVNRADGVGSFAGLDAPVLLSPEVEEPVGSAALRSLAGRWERAP